MHPLSPDISKMKDDEISEKISEIHKRMSFARYTGNYHMMNQLQMFLEDYNVEQQRRYQAIHQEKQDEWKDIVDINK